MRVLVVDDHELIRRGLRELISKEPKYVICGEAVDGRDAIQKAGELKPDIILMDMSMPNLGGLEATREIRRIHPHMQVLIVTQHEGQEMARLAFNAGASGYVLKSSLSGALVTVLENLNHGEPFANNSVLGTRKANMDSEGVLQSNDAFENALRESEKRFRTIADTAPVLLWMSETDASCSFVNKPWLKFRGRTMEQELGNGWVEGVHPDDVYRCTQTYLTAFKERRPFSMEYRLKHAGGDYRWILDNGVPRYTETGEFAGYIGSCIDVTGQKQTEQSLRESEEQARRREAALQVTAAQLQLVTEAMGIAVFRCNLDLRYESVNQRYAEWLGKPADQILGRSMVDVLGEEACETLGAHFDQVLSGEPVICEQQRTYPGIGRVWISAAYKPTFDSGGHLDSWVVALTDISDRKSKESAVVQQARLLDLSFDSVFVRNSENRITYWNKGAEEMYGWTREEAVGQVPHTLLRTEFPEPLEAITEHLRKENHWQGELLHTRKNGAHVAVLSRWRLARELVDGPESVMEINTDISGRKRAEEQLRSLVQTLEERVVERTVDLKDAHENLRLVNNDLMRAQAEERRRLALELHDGAGQLLAALKWKLDPLQKEMGGREGLDLRMLAKESLKLVDELSQEIRTVSHLLHPAMLDEAGLASALRLYVEGLQGRSGLTVELEIDPQLKRMPQEIEATVFRIVQESLTNVHRHARTSRAKVGVSQNWKQVKVRVEDHGGGIPGFKSLDEPNLKLGVGIRGMRERVRCLKGSFDFETGAGGTTVTAVLPIVWSSGIAIVGSEAA